MLERPLQFFDQLRYADKRVLGSRVPYLAPYALLYRWQYLNGRSVTVPSAKCSALNDLIYQPCFVRRQPMCSHLESNLRWP